MSMRAQDQALFDLWDGIVKGIPYNPSLGICGFWLTKYKELGSPIGPERVDTATGVAYQAFARGIVKWEPGKGCSVV